MQEAVDSKRRIVAQQQHVAEKHDFDPSDPLQAGTLLEPTQVGIHAEEVEGVAKDQFPRRDGVEHFKDLGGDGRVDVEQGG